MNNDLMLVSRELLRLAYRNAIGGAANLTTEEFLRVQRELKALLAAPAAQAAGSDLAAAAEKARNLLRNILRDKAGGVHYAAVNAASHQLTAALAAPVPTVREAEALAAEKALGIERLPVDPATQAVDEEDERARFEGWAEKRNLRTRRDGLVTTFADQLTDEVYQGWLARAALAAPVQSEQEPVAVLYKAGHVLTKADCGDVFDICCKVETPLYAAPVRAVRLPDVDSLSEIIRRADGNHSLGAGALAEKILDAVSNLNQSPNQKEITE